MKAEMEKVERVIDVVVVKWVESFIRYEERG
jgi:hypothetical protein